MDGVRQALQLMKRPVKLATRRVPDDGCVTSMSRVGMACGVRDLRA